MHRCKPHDINRRWNVLPNLCCGKNRSNVDSKVCDDNWLHIRLQYFPCLQSHTLTSITNGYFMKFDMLYDLFLPQITTIQWIRFLSTKYMFIFAVKRKHLFLYPTCAPAQVLVLPSISTSTPLHPLSNVLKWLSEWDIMIFQFTKSDIFSGKPALWGMMVDNSPAYNQSHPVYAVAMARTGSHRKYWSHKNDIFTAYGPESSIQSSMAIAQVLDSSYVHGVALIWIVICWQKFSIEFLPQTWRLFPLMQIFVCDSRPQYPFQKHKIDQTPAQTTSAYRNDGIRFLW